MRAYLFAVSAGVLCVLGSGCLSSTTTATGTPVFNDCNTSNTESYFQDYTTVSVGTSDKVAQGISPNGSAGAVLELNQVVFHMATSGVSSATLKIYQNTTSQPDSGTVIATSTVSTGLGSSSASTPIAFNFSPSANLNVGSQYSMVLSGTGGTIQLSVTASQSLPDFFWINSSGAGWAAETTENLRSRFRIT